MSFQEFNGVLLLSGHGHLGKTAWKDRMAEQEAAISGAYTLVPGPWPGSRAILAARGATGLNKAENPSFEVNVTDFWAGTHNCTVSQVDGGVYGEFCMRIDVTANGAAYVETPGGTNGVAVSADTDYTFSAFIKTANDSTSQVRLDVHWYNGAAYLSGSVGTLTSSRGWTRLVESSTSPATATHALLRLHCGTAVSTDVIYIDAVQFEESPAASVYADGGQSGCSWTGTTHNSTTTRSATQINLDDLSPLVNGQDPVSVRTVVRMPYAYDDAWPRDDNLIWIWYDSGTGSLVYLYYDAVNDNIEVYIRDATGGDSTTLADISPSFSAGDWLDIVVTMDFNAGGAGDYRLYVNGSSEDTDTTSNIAAPTVSEWNLGSNVAALYQAGFAFAEHSVWLSELSPTTIAAMAESPLVRSIERGSAPFMLQAEPKGYYTIAVVPSKYYLGWQTKHHDYGNGKGYVAITGQETAEGLEFVEWYTYPDVGPKGICAFKYGGRDIEWNFAPGAYATSVKISASEDLTIEGTSGSDVEVKASGASADVKLNAAGDVTLHGAKTIGDTNPVVCRVYNAAGIEIADNTWTKLTFNSERVDNDDMHSTVSNTGRITVPREGVYAITASIVWESNSTGERWLAVLCSNGGIGAVSQDASGATHQTVTTVWAANQNDYFEVEVKQTSGSALDVDCVSSISPEFTVVQLS